MPKKFHSDFQPNLTPKQMLELGVFGGHYFSKMPKEIPKVWFKNVKLSVDGKKHKELNYFKVSASQSLAVWQKKGWIHSDDPHGWFEWYCKYYQGISTLEPNFTDETRKLNDDAFDAEFSSSDISYEHVQPGVRSEVYYTKGNLEPNTQFKATLTKIDETGERYGHREQTVTVDEFGVARFIFEINEFGFYGVEDEYNGDVTIDVK